MSIKSCIAIVVLAILFTSAVFQVSEVRLGHYVTFAPTGVTVDQNQDGLTGTIYYRNLPDLPLPPVLNELLVGKESIEISLTDDKRFVKNTYRVVNPKPAAKPENKPKEKEGNVYGRGKTYLAKRE